MNDSVASRRQLVKLRRGSRRSSLRTIDEVRTQRRLHLDLPAISAFHIRLVATRSGCGYRPVLSGLASIGPRADGRAFVNSVVLLAPVLLLTAVLVTRVFELEAFGGAYLYIFLLPLSVLAGRRMQLLSLHASFFKLLRRYAYVAAVCAFVEFGGQLTLFGGELFVQSALVRAKVGQFHPIVLGVLFVAAIATTVQIASFRQRLTAILFLYAGVFVTGSFGPLVFGGVVALAALAPSTRKLSRWSSLLTFTSLAALAYFSTRVWSTAVVGTTVDEYSNGYRTALYALVPQMVQEAPLGYGPDGFPPGRWLIDSEYLGVRDISVTVDSELVLLVGEFGAVGLVLFTFALWLGLRTSFGTAAVTGLVLSAIVINGLTVALHAWQSLSLLLFLTLGMAFEAESRRRRVLRDSARRSGTRADARGSLVNPDMRRS